MAKIFNPTHRIVLDADCDRLQFHNPQLPASVISQLPGAIVEIVEVYQSSFTITTKAFVDKRLWRVEVPSSGIEAHHFSEI